MATVAEAKTMTRPLFHITEILGELRRELAMRRRLYPGWIAKGTLKQRDADRQTQILEQVIDEYSARSGRDDLFAARLAAAAVAAEVIGILETGPSDAARDRATERIARAMREGR
jgi:hypothetical protein